MKINIKLNKTSIIRLLVVMIFISTLMIMKKIEIGFLGYSDGANTLDMRLRYTADDVFQLFTTLGGVGRTIYVKYLCYDFMLTASFALVQNYILKFVMGKEMLNSKWSALLSIAYLRGIFDFSENIIILVLLNSFPSMSSYLITIASTVTRLKFTLLGMWGLTIFILFVARLIIKKVKRGAVI